MNHRPNRIAPLIFALAVICAASTVDAGPPAQAIDVTGRWLFQVETGAGSGTPTITFKMEGEKLTGHYSGQLGEADLNGTVKGQDIAFAFAVELEGNRLEVTYKGTVESKDSMKGTVDLGGFAQGTFTAKRQ